MTCKLVNLTIEDMNYLTIGQCLDYATEYIALKNGNTESDNKPRIRKATQADFDNF